MNNEAFGQKGPLIAQFATEQAAQGALDQLNQTGFRNGWMGVAKAMRTAQGTELELLRGRIVETAEQTLLGRIGQALNGVDVNEALYTALVKRGASEALARRIDGELVPGNAVIAVDPHGRREAVANIIKRRGGLVY